MESNIFLIITLTGFQIEHGWLICVWFYCFICFIGNSIDTEGFQEYVSSKLGEREENPGKATLYNRHQKWHCRRTLKISDGIRFVPD